MHQGEGLILPGGGRGHQSMPSNSWVRKLSAKSSARLSITCASRLSKLAKFWSTRYWFEKVKPRRESITTPVCPSSNSTLATTATSTREAEPALAVVPALPRESPMGRELYDSRSEEHTS